MYINSNSKVASCLFFSDHPITNQTGSLCNDSDLYMEMFGSILH
jgi:hypothetical protein